MKLGCLPRAFDPRVPSHGMMKALFRRRGVPKPALKPKVDNASGLPADVGMMLNDQLGDCTCAGLYHAVQIWTHATQGAPLTVADAIVQQLYEEAAGYVPGNASTDNGAVEQNVLTYAMNTGIPLPDGTRHKIASYIEVDPDHLDDVCEVVQEFGLCYIGFSVPAGFMDAGPMDRWDVSSTYGDIEGGHCVIVTGFDRTDPRNPTFNITSWGTRQWTMTAAFFHKYVDEAYALASQLWIETDGDSPYGLTLTQLAQLGDALRD